MARRPETQNSKLDHIRLGLSACLGGEKVRYDGGHRLEPLISGTLGQYLEFTPVCPEVECGLGVPREPMRLVGRPDAPRLLTVHSGRDLTRPLLAWARRRVGELAREDLSGFIFKSSSPSCGPARVKVHNERGAPAAAGPGLFARVFLAHFPLVPVVDEEQLHDPELRENFVERLFFQRRWREFLAQRPDRGQLGAFHDRHRLQILAHSPGHGRRLEQLLASETLPLLETLSAYQTLALAALKLPATSRKNLRVLDHLLGRLKQTLSRQEREELRRAVDSYRRGETLLIAPVSLINHYADKYRQGSLQGSYLHPHPLELKLRYHA
ncbi:MAG: DUF523 and DUF1722 domain-containing protein [Desulfobaccales bacterium]